jgi:hypothetical protein
VSDLVDDSLQLPVSPKLLLALRDAVKHMQAHAARKAAAAQAEGSENGAPTASVSAP